MIRSADLKIEPHCRRVTRNGEKIELSALTYDLLIAMVNCAPNIANTEHLLATVWENKVVGAETLTQRVAILRKALGEDNHQHKYVESVRGRGYRWLAQVQIEDEQSVPLKFFNRFRLHTIVVSIALLSSFFFAINAFYFSNEPFSNKAASPNISLESSPADKLREAWRYYRKFDADSNLIAIKLFRHVLKEQPDEVSALVGLSAAYSQESTKFNGPPENLVEGLALAKTALEISPNNAEVWWALGFNSDARGHIDAAIKYYEKALQLDPEEQGVRASLAYLYAIKGELATALKMNIETFSSDAHYRHLQIAQILRLLQFHELAERWYERADELNPDSVFAALGRAEHLYSMGRFTDAREVVEAAHERGIRRPELFVLLGLIDAQQNRWNSMKKLFETASQIDQHSTLARCWQIWADSLHGFGPDVALIDAEISRYEQLAREGDNWASNFIGLAILEIAKQQPEKAIKHLQSAFSHGYLDISLLQKFPALQPLQQNAEFTKLLENMQKQVLTQRKIVLSAKWLPDNFLDPKAGH